METFSKFYARESRLSRMLGLGAMAVTSAYGDFAKDWSKHYQTSNNPEKEARARQVTSKSYTLPADASRAIQTAVDIFAGDEGKTKEQLTQYLKHTGAVESGYRTTVQDGGGPARSYWQVEPTTAMDLVKNSSAFFGKKFHGYFGPNALETLQTWDHNKWSEYLQKHADLGATMAAAKWLASNW